MDNDLKRIFMELEDVWKGDWDELSKSLNTGLSNETFMAVERKIESGEFNP